MAEEKEQSVKVKIKELLDKRYTRSQLINDFSFARSTVDTAISEYKESHDGKLPAEAIVKENKPQEANGKGAFLLPTTVKAGQGREMITPEAIMNQYLIGDGDTGKGILKGMMLLRAAQMMVLSDVEIMKGQSEAQSKALQPILDIMQKSREDMDAAAQRARESNEEIAMRAAAGAGAQILPMIDQKFEEAKKEKADIASVPNPIQGMFARTMETTLNNLTQRMMGGGGQPQQGQGLPPGWSDNRQKGGN